MLAVAGASTTLLLAAVLESPGPSSAESAPQAAGIVTAATASFGEQIVTSNLPLAVQFGRTSAAYNQTESQASSATLDLGGLGTLLVSTPICGTQLFTTKDLPHPLTANSENGPDASI